MSQVAEQARLLLLADMSRRAVRRAERLGAHIERIFEAGGEPSDSLVAEYLGACCTAEVLLLERALATPGEPQDDDDGLASPT